MSFPHYKTPPLIPTKKQILFPPPASTHESDKTRALDQLRSELERRWEAERKALESRLSRVEAEVAEKEGAMVAAVNAAAAEGDQKVDRIFFFISQ